MTEFLQYLFGRLKNERPVTKEVNGQAYAVCVDGTLGDPVRELAPQWTAPTLQLNSLSGLVDACNAGLDGFSHEEAALHIVDPFTVNLVAIKADEFGQRHIWASARYAHETKFEFDHFYIPEKFRILFQASFYLNEDAVKVLRVASTVSCETSIGIADDGVSQAITVKDGAVQRTAVELPSDGIPLVPWRTWREVNPVTSKFLLRMKSVKDDLPQIALFEIDAKWQVDTIESIRAYLLKQLPQAIIIG